MVKIIREEKNRRNERLRKKWMEQIYRIGDGKGKEIRNIRELACNKKKWKQWIKRELYSKSDALKRVKAYRRERRITKDKSLLDDLYYIFIYLTHLPQQI